MPEIAVVNIGDTDENADWIRTPEVRESEAAIHDRLAEEAEQVEKGGPGSGHWAHPGRPPDHGGSATGGGWQSYVAALDTEFGAWSDKKVQEASEEMRLGMAQALQLELIRHGGGAGDWKETFSVEHLKKEASGFQETFQAAKSQLETLQRMTHWDLVHRTGGAESVMLLHGRSTPAGASMPDWIDKVGENLSCSEAPSVAHSFTFTKDPEGGSVITFEVPIGAVKLSWRSAKSLRRAFPKEYEYVLKGGNYRGHARMSSAEAFLRRYPIEHYRDSTITGNELPTVIGLEQEGWI